jgi:hypothetical protein
VVAIEVENLKKTTETLTMDPGPRGPKRPRVKGASHSLSKHQRKTGEQLKSPGVDPQGQTIEWNSGIDYRDLGGI